MNADESYLDNYVIIGKVWKGNYSKVKEVRCQSTGIVYAAKIFLPRFPLQMAISEINYMTSVSGLNIVTLSHSNTAGLYRKKSGDTYTCAYIIMELCTNGNLFDIIYATSAFSQNLMKVIFLQIISALSSCHRAAVCHRDLKPENILFDSDFVVKLTDFGSSTYIQDLQRHNIFPSKYVAPEALTRNAYRGEVADVFSLGVILFVMCTQNFPFYSVNSCDSLYSKFRNNKEEFWKLQGRKAGKQGIPEDLKDLLGKMLEMDPEVRISLDEVVRHEWCQGVTVNLEELVEEIQNKRKMNLEHAKKQAESRVKYGPRFRGFKCEGDADSLSISFDDTLLKPCKGKISKKFTKILSGLHPAIVLHKVVEYLQANESAIKISKKYYKITAKIITHFDTLQCVFTVHQEDDHYALNVDLISGEVLDLIKVVKDIDDALKLD